MQLRPCAKCRRHVDLTEVTCPFCKAQLAPAPTRTALPAGRLSRAAVFAGATLAGACWTGSTASTTPTEEQQRPVEVKPAPIAPGEIRGTLTNSNGVPLANVRIILQAEDTGASQHGLTDQNGEYVFSGLAPGNYLVTHESQDPRQRAMQTQVTLTPDAGKRANLTLILPAPDRGPCCKPYGAPPARRRIV